MTTSVGEADAGVRLAVPSDLRELTAADLPVLDVSALSGARVSGQRGWSSEALQVQAACVRGPSDRWLPGADALVLERATHLAVQAFSAQAGELHLAPSSAPRDGEVFVQPLEGEAAAGARRVRGAHRLFFVGESADVVVCTVLCAEAAGQSRCDDVAASVVVEGHPVPEPPAGIVARTTIWAFEHPSAALAVAAGVFVVAVGILLWKRPRPRA